MWRLPRASLRRASSPAPMPAPSASRRAEPASAAEKLLRGAPDEGGAAGDAGPLAYGRRTHQSLVLLEILHRHEVADRPPALGVAQLLGDPFRRDRNLDAADLAEIGDAFGVGHRPLVLTAFALVDRLERRLGGGACRHDNLNVRRIGIDQRRALSGERARRDEKEQESEWAHGHHPLSGLAPSKEWLSRQRGPGPRMYWSSGR